MRWSLILSVFVAVQSALSFLCAALVIPPSLDGLEKRASHDPAKISSKAYREHSKSHPNAYHVQGLGPTGKLTAETKVTKTTLKKGERHHYGHELLTSADGKKLHADHVFEVQMLHRHLEKSPGVPKFKDLNGNLQKKLRNILNGPKNMAIIPASINQSKGQLIKHGMEGKKINRNKGRDEYALKSYGTAHKTAKKLDDALEEHGYKLGDNNLQNKLHRTFVAAGLPPGSSRHSSPASSRSSSRNRGQSNSRQSNPRPSTPGPPRPATPGPSRQSHQGPSSSSPNRGRSGKRNASPGNSPPKTRQRTGNSPPKTRRSTRKK